MINLDGRNSRISPPWNGRIVILGKIGVRRLGEQSRYLHRDRIETVQRKLVVRKWRGISLASQSSRSGLRPGEGIINHVREQLASQWIQLGPPQGRRWNSILGAEAATPIRRDL